LGNPNTTELEVKMATLENGEDGISTGSGMAAISTTLLAMLKQGDHIVAHKSIYGCTFGLLSEMLPELGIDTTFVDAVKIDSVLGAMRANTKIIYIETPANPTMEIIDIKEVARVAHQFGAYLVVDNTFMTPSLQKFIAQRNI
jgi:methionine-gamma-lyase